MKKEKEVCQHNWEKNYDCFEDAVNIMGERLDIPVKCSKCGLEGYEVYKLEKYTDLNSKEIE